jgi:hypothetical protein
LWYIYYLRECAVNINSSEATGERRIPLGYGLRGYLALAFSAIALAGCSEKQEPPANQSHTGAQPTVVEPGPAEAPEELESIDTTAAGAVKKSIAFTQAGGDEIVPVPTEVVSFKFPNAIVDIGLPHDTEASWCIHLTYIGEEWEVGEVEANSC